MTIWGSVYRSQRPTLWQPRARGGDGAKKSRKGAGRERMGGSISAEEGREAHQGEEIEETNNNKTVAVSWVARSRSRALGHGHTHVHQ